MEIGASTPKRISYLVAYAASAIKALVWNYTHNTIHYVPHNLACQAARNHEATVARLQKALSWLGALCTVFAGRTDYLKPLPTRPARPGQLPPPRAANPTPRPARPELTPEQHFQAETRAICRAFQTQSIGKITYRMCRILGIDSRHELFPHSTITNTETPAQWSARHFPDLPPPPKKLPASYWLRKLRRQQKQQAKAGITPEPPEPHRRE